MYFRNSFMDKDGFRIGLFIILIKHDAVSFSNGETTEMVLFLQTINFVD